MEPHSSPLTPKGVLYIVATPIGNLEDITFRAVRILREADLIAAEDTRHSRKLLSHFGISKPLTSYFDHNKELKGRYILDQLAEGVSVALITDAGTPCISDPGYQLVRDAVAAGFAVVPVPGPSAAVTALSASGLPTDAFVFEGFLPNKQGKRREKLAMVKGEQRVVIFYESPNRLLATLMDLREVLGERELVVARELTKIYEEFIRGSCSPVIEKLQDRTIKGEVVILVAPAAADPEHDATESVAELLSCLMAGEGLSLKDAVKQVVLRTGRARSEVYTEALKLKGH
ncbi:16S rRNA (cytidine1402-2'-O)-methyltransferase [Geotalea daltonii FRC-32]|uniref:Ribosomal RNA small subunit methyltransferase I n=1 Tax=Geotalea daltonii (strain DSM 22248 / JCM 15807 / FRC-32) TaxID=316067 RepID=B9M5A1_GEODF|nr:16S rRNA (cytidine(1402)-2'-O)-methyltransferase [Geotalea daltonii]ACM19856.1 16S rRNA (cytidine1402-2'-O)-methyltransferase [Geotalea daltonii FRC-32]